LKVLYLASNEEYGAAATRKTLHEEADVNTLKSACIEEKSIAEIRESVDPLCRLRLVAAPGKTRF
jgi:hypothetical protein